MARRARIDLKGYYYHVVCRGQRKNPLFFSPEDRQKYFEIINELLMETDIELYAYSLMTNHVHLDIFRNEYPLHKFMSRLNTKYALYFNKKYNLVGHVFQGRYKSFIVLDNSSLVYLIKYIHLNAVRAGIVKNPADYEYSSAKFYEGGKEKNIPCIKKLPILKEKTKYLQFMNSEKVEYPIYKDSIGNKDIYLFFEKRKPGREKSKFKEKRKQKINIKEELKNILKMNKIQSETFIHTKFSRKNKKYKQFVFKKLIKLGFTQADIARLMQCNKSTIGRILK